MGNLSTHFDSSEFKCKCGKCTMPTINSTLISRLEQLRTNLGCSSIVVTSGYRCPTYSVKVGGSSTDAHTKGIAADIICYDSNRSVISPERVAAAAELIGFGGIGLMNGAVHVDCRDLGGFVNNHWFGNEVTGDNYIRTFQTGGGATNSTHSIKVIIDGKTVIDKTI